jgi:hypothetical protein
MKTSKTSSTSNARNPRITVVTAGNLSTCPRMLKAADAFSGAGYRVHVVSTNTAAWAAETDQEVKRARTWDWSIVQAGRVTTGARFRLSQALAEMMGVPHLPMPVVARAYSRLHDELVREIMARPADLIYGGTTGALAAVAEAGRRLQTPYAVDFEDFHSGEHAGAGSELTNLLADKVERDVITQARFVTTSSPMIAEEYAARHDVRPLTIHNTFSMTAKAAGEQVDGPLRLYWFSQTLGPQRGLEDVIRAAGESHAAVELHLRARPVAAYLESLRGLQSAVAPALRLIVHDPASPDDMVALTQPYDAGLACEEPYVLNRRLCLTNKIFTYLAAGVPMLLSRTPAQARIEAELGAAAFGYDCGDVQGLAGILRRLAADRSLRCRARAAARDAAARRWHWEHPADRGALVAAVEGVLA